MDGYVELEREKWAGTERRESGGKGIFSGGERKIWMSEGLGNGWSGEKVFWHYGVVGGFEERGFFLVWVCIMNYEEFVFGVLFSLFSFFFFSALVNDGSRRVGKTARERPRPQKGGMK